MEIKKIRKHRRFFRARRSLDRRHRQLSGLLARFQPLLGWLRKHLGFLRFLNPKRYVKILDWYIIKKFIGTYFFSIALIISIAIVFDFNENLSKFTQYHAPWRAIVFDY